MNVADAIRSLVDRLWSRPRSRGVLVVTPAQVEQAKACGVYREAALAPLPEPHVITEDELAGYVRTVSGADT